MTISKPPPAAKSPKNSPPARADFWYNCGVPRGQSPRFVIFDILPGAGWPGTGGTQTRSPPRAGGNIRQRTQQRIVASLKTGNFQYEGEIRLCARVVQYPRGALSYSIFIRALTGASTRLDFESAPLFFCRRRSSRNKEAAKERRDK